MPRSPLASVVAITSLTAALPASADVFVCDVAADAVRWFDDAGASKGTLSGNGLDAPAGLASGADGLLYVASAGTQQVLRFNPSTGAYVDEFVAPGNALVDPNGIAFGGDGSLFVANFSSHTVLRYDTNGDYIETLGGPATFSNPVGIAAGPGGDVFVTANKGVGDFGVYRFDGSTGDAEGWFTSFGNKHVPWHAEFGPDGQLYTPIYLNDTIQRTTAAGVSTTFTNLDGAIGLTFLPDGDLLVTSFADKKVHRIDGVTGADLGIFAQGFTQPTAILHVVPEPAAVAVLLAAPLMLSRWRVR